MSADRLAELLTALASEIADRIKPELRAVASRPAAEAVVEPLTLTYDQVGERLNLSETSVRKLWKTGELPSVLIGGLRFTRTADLAAYVAALTPSLPGEERTALALVRDAA